MAIAIDRGDPEARDKMVRANLRLVVRIARNFTGRGLELPDLIAEGNLGLLRAVEGFDPDRETRFATYAVYWIRQSIRRAIIHQGRPIRIPAYMVELLYRWQQASDRLAEKLERRPTPEEVALYLGISAQRLPYIRCAIFVDHLTPLAEQAESGWTLEEMIVDERSAEEPLEECDPSRVKSRLDSMSPRESTVLRLRFGLDSCEPHSLREVGEILGIPRERVRQIESEALGQLADFLEESPRKQPA